MFVKQSWYVVAWSDELASDAIISREALGEAIALYRDAKGSIVALEDRCCHHFAPLSRGRLEDGCNLRCMYHGMKFGPDGRCIEIPGQETIPPAARVKVLPATEKYGAIWIWPGNPEQADPALIPDNGAYREGEFVQLRGFMDYDANFQLILDNLADLSHAAYVHAQSFGTDPAVFSDPPEVRRIDGGLRVTRWIERVSRWKQDIAKERIGGFEHIGDSPEAKEAMYATYDIIAPGILLFRNESYAAGSIPADKGEPPPGLKLLSGAFSLQALTPLSEQRTRYFYSWGPTRGPDEDKLAASMFAVAGKAFEEDRQMIEAQQRNLNRQEPGLEVMTTHDFGLIQVRAAVRNKLKQEAAGD